MATGFLLPTHPDCAQARQAVHPANPISNRCWRLPLLAVLFLGLISCDEQNVWGPDEELGLALRGLDTTLSEGDTLALRAFQTNERDEPVREVTDANELEWSSSDSQVALVEDGVLKARSSGETTIEARHIPSGTRADARVRVWGLDLEVAIPNATGRAGEVSPEDAKVVLRNQAGAPIQGRDIRFSVVSGGGAVSPSVASTDADGEAQTEWTFGGELGTQELQAEVKNPGSASVKLVAEVNPGRVTDVTVDSPSPELDLVEGDQLQLDARAEDRFGNHVQGATLQWASSDPDVATVSNEGLVTAEGTGEAELAVAAADPLTESLRGAAGPPGNPNVSLPVHVRPGGPQGASLTATAGDEQTGTVGGQLSEPLEIRAVDRNGEGLAGLEVEWAVLTDGGGSVTATRDTTDQEGFVEAVWELGEEAGEQEAQAVLADEDSVVFTATAEPGEATEVEVEPEAVHLDPDASTQLSAEAVDRFGNTLHDATPVWRSQDSSVATVTSLGMVRAVSEGTTSVTARVDGVEGGSEVTVEGSDDDGGGEDPEAPSAVTDLAVEGTSDTSVTLGFTEVAAGDAGPADYQVRFADPPIGDGWDDATVVDQGSCADPVEGQETGAHLTCTVDGLDPGTELDFQVVAVHPEEGTTSEPSNVVTASTGDGGGTDEAEVASVSASPQEVVLEFLEATKDLEATAYDDSGVPISGVEFNWESDDPDAIEVDENGMITAKAMGTVLVFVSTVCCDVGDTVTVHADQLVSSVEIAPETATIQEGDSKAFTATAYDGGGSEVSGVDLEWSTSDESVASVDSDGNLSAHAEGTTAVISAVADGTTDGDATADTASVTVEAPSSPPPSQLDNPELPRETIRWSPPDSEGRTIELAPGDDLQAAIDGASLGDEIVLPRDGRWTGTIDLPERDDGEWITIRCGDCDLPSYQDRISKEQAEALPQIVIEDVNSAPGVRIEDTNGWWITGLAVVVEGSTTGEGFAIDRSSRVVLDRSAVLVPSGLELRRGIRANGSWIEITGSRVEGVNSPGFESQAIAQWRGPGPLRVHDSFLEAASIGFLTGGVNGVAAAARPQDIEFTRNHVYKRPSWFNQSDLVVKNSFEHKGAERVLVEGNVFENNWADGQTGRAILLKSRRHPMTDITFRLNIVRNTRVGMDIAWQDEPAERILVENVLFKNLGEESGFDTDGGRVFQFCSPPNHFMAHKVTAESVGNSWFNFGCSASGRKGFVVRDVVSLGVGVYGAWATDDWTTMYDPPYDFADIWAVERDRGGCPVNAGLEDAGFGDAQTCVSDEDGIPSGAGADLGAIEAATVGVRDAHRPN